MNKDLSAVAMILSPNQSMSYHLLIFLYTWYWIWVSFHSWAHFIDVLLQKTQILPPIQKLSMNLLLEVFSA